MAAQALERAPVVAVWSSTRRDVPGWDLAMRFLASAGCVIVDPGPAAAATPEHADEVLAEADALIVGTDPVPASLLARAPRLRLVSKPGIGVDRIDVAAATRMGIGVAHTPGSNADTVADHTVGMMLAVLRHVVTLDAATREGRGWDHWPVVGGELSASTVAVLGTGAIGRAVIRRLARGFGAHVLAWDAVPVEEVAGVEGVEYTPLDEALRRADVVTIHLPLTDQTRPLLGERELGLMRPGSVLVNAARGGIVDANALLDAVSRGHLAGAALDVFATEPLPDSPLRADQRVILTPHVAGYSERSLVRARLMLAEDIVAALDGEPRHLVNPDVVSSPASRIHRKADARRPHVNEKGSPAWTSR